VSTLTAPLDTPIWSALTTRQQTVALGDGFARRLDPAFGPFAATGDDSPASFEALAELLVGQDTVALFARTPPEIPDRLHVQVRRAVTQMILDLSALDEDASERSLPALRVLEAADVPAMQSLVALTKPGPFAARTHELGRYLGPFDDDELVAMAGERLRLDGFVEISAVCTHPSYRGRGLAGSIVAELSRAALARGEMPFLHVMADNDAAQRAYRRVGFVVRRTLDLTVLQLRVANTDKTGH
jgi:predicted GNAT family acetyltransferase